MSASGDIGVVSTAVTVTTDFNDGWSSSETNTSTSTRTYNMKQGQLCAPASVQLKLNCTSEIMTDSGWNLYLFDKSGKSLGYAFALCGGGISSPIIDTVCSSVAAQAAPVTIDVGGGNAPYHRPWTMEGCMYN